VAEGDRERPQEGPIDFRLETVPRVRKTVKKISRKSSVDAVVVQISLSHVDVIARRECNGRRKAALERGP
jgi:hypothetical protein